MSFSEKENIVVEYSGWCKIDPEDARFVYCGGEPVTVEFISGTVWQQMDEDERSNWVLEDLVQTQIDAFDGSIEYLDVIVE